MFEIFEQALDPRWSQTTLGGGNLQCTGQALRLGFAGAQAGQYADAQIDDYGQLPRARFPWRPALRMQVEARASHPAAQTSDTASGQFLQGTAGFGFWNYPFSVRGDVLMLPEAIWFFYASPPSNMALVPGQPGWGWKAQVVHSMRPDALLSAIPLGFGMLQARLTGKDRAAGRWMQRLTGTSEALIAEDLTTWHSYALEWHPHEARFLVDEREMLRVPDPPTRPLGFVAWLDNQFAVATPRGQLRFGTVQSGPQWLEIARLRIEPGNL
jgi:hypothetical protein